MNNELMAQIFNDAIAASQMPTMAGKHGREHRGYITTTSELIEAMLFTQRELKCLNTKFGVYDCYTPTQYGYEVDYCLVPEINKLNADGIKTIGCCCGHGRKQGYIQVSPKYCEKMLALGYTAHIGAEWCFNPKTILPAKRGTEGQE